MHIDPPHTTELLLEVIHEKRRTPVTRANAFAKRLDECTAAVQAECLRFLAEHGDDPRAWPIEKLGRIADIESRRLALEALGLHAKHRCGNIGWSDSDLDQGKGR